MRIAVDVDDVLTNTGKNFIEYHNRKFGTDLGPGQFYDSDYLKPFGFPREEAIKRILEYIEQNTPQMVPMEGSREALQQMKENHELIVITGRAENVMQITKEWIKLNYPGIFTDFICTNVHQVNGGDDKGKICKKHEVDVLIEDYLKYAHECVREGIRVLLMKQPWNANKKIDNKLISRVSSWDDVLKEIGSLTSSK